jgi:hypothetical protein
LFVLLPGLPKVHAQAHKQAPAAQTAVDPLALFAGLWRQSFFVRTPDNRYAISFGEKEFSLKEQEISFAFDYEWGYPESQHPHVAVSLARAGKSGYRLNVASSGRTMTVKDLPLAYAPEKGFFGEGVGVINAETVPVDVEIAPNAEGGLIWRIQQRDNPENKTAAFRYGFEFCRIAKSGDTCPKKPDH